MGKSVSAGHLGLFDTLAVPDSRYLWLGSVLPILPFSLAAEVLADRVDRRMLLGTQWLVGGEPCCWRC